MRTNDEIINILIKLKEEKGYSLTELAKKVGMAKSALSRYFNKNREFPLNRVNEFAKALGVTAEYILGFEDPGIATIYNQLEQPRQKKVYLFAETRIKDVTRTHYQEFLNYYGKYLAKETVRKINKQVRACIQEAVRDQVIPQDFTYKVELIGSEPKEERMKYLSEKETKALITALDDEQSTSRLMLLLQLAIGMRIGEVAALTYDALNFKSQTIYINHTWNYANQSLTTTKTKENRYIKVEVTILKHLQQWIMKQKKNQLSGLITNPKKLVFAQYNGLPPTNEAINKSLKRACKRAGIKEVTSHSLRHTHVSILLYRGMDLSSIAQRVGHKSATTTANIYAHIIEELQNKSDKLSDNAIKELFS